MRVAVISDIHANLPALQAVLADLDGERLDAIWCLGDIVGYGPAPNECCALVRERADLCLCGNHDLGVIGALELATFSGEAAAAARWTQGVLAPEHRAWLGSLSPQAAAEQSALFHASPRDPVWDYVLSDQVAAEALRLTSAPVVLVGHSHVALCIEQADGSVRGGLAPARTETPIAAPPRRLLNPGSVGQPRDGDPHAAWLLIDFDADRGTFRRVAYDVEATQAAIRAAGLPEVLARRLAHGL
jgi:diadenosine tetraphosphatase ApaH/serine/threonine PP2A family protein phosphatase